MSKPKPTRNTTAGRVYLNLRRLANEQVRPTSELLQLYALEGFLSRLARSPDAERLVLKGGVLLAAYDARRPTKDVDLTAGSTSNDAQTMRTLVSSIVEIRIDDGLEFSPDRTAAETIREGEEYSGTRVTVPCRLASATVDFHVDISVGDPVWPRPTEIEIPRILGNDRLVVRGAPIPMVLAEKIVTAIQRGSANTRWRDFVDIATLARRNELNAAEIRRSLEVVAEHRNTRLEPLKTVLPGFAELAQSRWAAWRRRQRLEAVTPELFEALLDEVSSFADPVLLEHVTEQNWDPQTRLWHSRK